MLGLQVLFLPESCLTPRSPSTFVCTFYPLTGNCSFLDQLETKTLIFWICWFPKISPSNKFTTWFPSQSCALISRSRKMGVRRCKQRKRCPGMYQCWVGTLWWATICRLWFQSVSIESELTLIFRTGIRFIYFQEFYFQELDTELETQVWFSKPEP